MLAGIQLYEGYTTTPAGTVVRGGYENNIMNTS